MAEEEEAPSNNGGGWWDSLMNETKTKLESLACSSAEVLEFMKKDLGELSSVVKTEVVSVVNDTATIVKERLQLDNEESTAGSMKKSVSNFFGSVKEVLSPSPSCDLEEALLIKDGSPVAVSKLQTKIYSLSNDDKTYLEPIPESERNQFEAWLSVSQDLITSVDRLTAMLASNQILQDKYNTLVPVKIEHSKFWERFLFRKALLEDKEAEQQRKVEREKNLAENYPWHQENKLVDGVELTEEEQIKILADYEEEQKKKKDSPTKDATNSSTDIPTETEPKEKLSMKEKHGMVIVSNVTSSQASTSSSKASTDGDWEKEFDLDEVENEGK